MFVIIRYDSGNREVDANDFDQYEVLEDPAPSEVIKSK